MSNYRCRLLEPQDIPKIKELVRGKSAKLGIDFWVPKLDDPRAHRVFVFETKDGQLLGAIVIRTIWEAICLANDPRIMAAAAEFNDKIQTVLSGSGVDNVVAWVPRVLIKEKRKSGMQRFMEKIGFKRMSDEFVCFDGEVKRG